MKTDHLIDTAGLNMGPSAIKSNDRLTAVTLLRAHTKLRKQESVVWQDWVHMKMKHCASPKWSGS